MIEKTVRKLSGISCLELGEEEPLKQEICSSRMFGKRLTTIEPSGYLRPERGGEAAGAELSVQEESRQHPHRHVQS